MSRATRRISAMEKPSLHKAIVAMATRPNSSSTKGPMVPSGRSGARSSILLRRRFQISSRLSYSSRVVAWTMVTPVLESEVISSISGMVRICSSMRRVISSSTCSGTMPGKAAETTASRITIGGSSCRGKVRNCMTPARITSTMKLIVTRDVFRENAVMPPMTPPPAPLRAPYCGMSLTC